MKAFKGFHKNLTCLGFQFREDMVNRTEEANCAQNGFHCAENPLDCFSYYPNWRNSVYYEVDATGDLDEDAVDSKISCTEMRLIRRLSLEQMLFEAAVYMVGHPKREWNYRVRLETGTAWNGFGIVRGKNPRAAGGKGEFLLILKEEQDSPEIEEIALLKIDGKRYHSDEFYDVYGKC
ncbi:MAG: hypothetical protein HFG77_07605 [Hungatella sp.]|nr:hypothetical protein C818_00267 [Lachnospiraceae bacterium MD308]MCI9636247.1 hypothetical protein [Hungatella sp.]